MEKTPDLKNLNIKVKTTFTKADLAEVEKTEVEAKQEATVVKEVEAETEIFIGMTVQGEVAPSLEIVIRIVVVRRSVSATRIMTLEMSTLTSTMMKVILRRSLWRSVKVLEI